MDYKHRSCMRNRKPEEQLLFILTRQQFLETHHQKVQEICNNEKIQWDIVYETAKQHQVAPLIYYNLMKCTSIHPVIPQNILYQFKICVAQNIVIKERRAQKLMEVLEFAEKNSIEVMLIKGAAFDLILYDKPWYTSSSDIDLIIRSREERINNKYKAEIVNHIIDILRHGNGMQLCECEYFVHHDVSMNRILPINFHNIWNDAIKIEFRGQDLLIMSPEDMLISACINSCRKRVFRLKSLFDISEIICKYTEIKWDKIIKMSEEYNCSNVIYTSIMSTRVTLGCELSDRVLDSLKIPSLRRKLIHFLIQHMSFSSLPSLYSGINIYGKYINLSFILLYATFSWAQSWRYTKLICRGILRLPR